MLAAVEYHGKWPQGNSADQEAGRAWLHGSQIDQGSFWGLLCTSAASGKPKIAVQHLLGSPFKTIYWKNCMFLSPAVKWLNGKHDIGRRERSIFCEGIDKISKENLYFPFPVYLYDRENNVNGISNQRWENRVHVILLKNNENNEQF